ncbi:hypothetical protein [Solirubrobacter deserti]|uniref:Hydroxyacid dehydrogenase n=1 Tax=Solirubrobacter deserti TaxID=2282478 RepID=A0ABT4RHE9_9ACTN|nr:hypothetical protein [Solirubrobacter deserti]MDA0137962.1 hypothetical protein [Solirubrobacter deserti]
MRTLADLGPSKLLPAEQERVRAAADVLLFSEDAHEPATAEALEAIRALSAHLVATERWSETSASRLREDLEACGPALLVG